MAEHYEVFRRFEYRQNSNLVLQREGPGPNQNEPTGEPESLAGRLSHSMGDKVLHEGPADFHSRVEKKRKLRASTGDRQAAALIEEKERLERGGGAFPKRTRLDLEKGATVLSADVSESFSYKPTTRQTRVIYEHLLSELVKALGDQPQDVLRGAADEILRACKSSSLKDSEKKSICEDVLGDMNNEQFTAVYQLTRQIHDFKTEEETASAAEAEGPSSSAGDTTGVAVVFDEDDDGDRDEDEIYTGVAAGDDDEDEADGGAGATGADGEGEQRFLEAKFNEGDDDEGGAAVAVEGDNPYALEVAKVDAHWLQRELGKILSDAHAAVATEKEILELLLTPDPQECENKLVYILKYDNFRFAKVLLNNRFKVYYCTKLGQAQSAEEKNRVMEEMKKTPQGLEVLEQIEAVGLRRNREKEFARNVRREAAILAAIRDGTASSIDGGRRSGEMLDDALEGTTTSIINHKSGIRTSLGGRESVMGKLASSIPSGRGGSDRPGATANDEVKPSTYLDLENLAFEQGGRLMANSRVVLPDGSQRLESKAYDEVIVQPYKPIDERQVDVKKVPITELPEWAQPAFSTVGITKLNLIQSKVYPVAFHQPERNILVSAPTGSGKTNVALLAMLGLISRHRDPKTGVIDTAAFKIVYISPMKALVTEQVLAFQKRFESYGIIVKELTGDVTLSRYQIEETHVLVTTPEKWDVISRKAGERAYTQLVKLIIIDEVHLLHDSRGPVLEAIVARTLRQSKATQEPIRLVGLSATLPNYEDVARFLNVSLKEGEGLFVFGNHYRPVPLLQTCIGLKEKKAIKRLKTMNTVTYQKVLENAGQNQVLVFVHSRRDTIKTARMLRQMAMDEDTLARFLQESSASREILQSEVENIKTPDLKELLPYGFAVHHAGLPRTDRRLVEDLFADRHIQVLVSTATLAWGVNLPAHTVIIKGTQVYLPEKGAWSELSPLDVMQMMGRAGRPQYDKSGHGIIITAHSELQYYLSLNNQQLPIESQLVSMLPDIINAEVVLGSIRSCRDVVDWMASTYLYTRLLRNPTLYGFAEECLKSDPDLEQVRTDLAHSALLLLDKHHLIRYDKRGGTIQLTALGRVASHYYIRHPSIAVYNEHLRPTLTDIELLRVFSLSFEFRYIPVRGEEKIELSKLMERVPIPVKGGSSTGTVEESSSKANVLLQAYISRLKLEGFALAADMTYIQQSAGRIMRALFEICLRRGWSALAMRALLFCKMIDRRMWSTMTPLRQFKALPEDVLRRLERKDFPWDRFFDLSAAELGELVRMQKMGKMIHRYVHEIPKVDLSAYVQPLTRSTLLVEVSVTPDFRWDDKVHDPAGEAFWLIVEDVNGETVLHHEMFILRENQVKEAGVELLVNFAVPITEPLPPNYFLRCVSDRWMQSESLLPISFKHLILPDKNPPHSELLDLQPLPVTALRFTEAEALYSSECKAFGPIQTQVFSSLYTTNDNVLICAPPASQLHICAEFAILRMIKHESVQRCVYIAPYKSTAHRRYLDWSSRLGKLLGLVVNELTGEMSVDLRLVSESNIIIATPERWDYVSRRWRTRKVLQQIRLFIVDELQLLDSDVGAALEVCVSRMRYISAQLPSPIRIVGLSLSLANAKDVGDWFGVGANGIYNFHPNVRTIPLEISLQGFDIYYRSSRLIAMMKIVYRSIRTHCAQDEDAPAIVFCPDRKQTRLTAVDILLQTAAEGMPKRFLHISEEAMSKHAANAKEKSLEETLKCGVGYVHEGFTEEEIAVVEKLFKLGAIQVLVVSEKLAWGISVAARLVIIQDTKKYDARERRWNDYKMSDVLQMIGLAGRRHVDQFANVVFLCPSPKKEYYKKFIFEPLPVESRLDHSLADHINAEVTLRTVESKQDAVDWLTWTLYYRRLTKNPNFYSLQGVSHTHLSEHLSELIEQAVEALEAAQCIAVEGEDGSELSGLNLGLIAAFYYITYTTIELLKRTVTATTKRKAMIEILCAAGEFAMHVPIRFGEETVLKAVAIQQSVKLGQTSDVNDPHIKTLLLLYAHFSRTELTTDLALDQVIVIEQSIRIVHALVDVISSNGWLTPALVAMELSQMIVQALHPTKSVLFQLPHFDQERVDLAKEMKVLDIFDLINMEDDDRLALLKGLTSAQIDETAQACNRYPVINIEYDLPAASKKSVSGAVKVDDTDEVKKEGEGQQPVVYSLEAGKPTTLVVNLERVTDSEELGPVYAPYFPKPKDEQWWLTIGRPSSNTLLAIKRIAINKLQSTVKLDFDVPEEPGSYRLVLNLMCDCYMGCDQEYTFTVQAV